jgi:hypothetical protein
MAWWIICRVFDATTGQVRSFKCPAIPWFDGSYIVLMTLLLVRLGPSNA